MVLLPQLNACGHHISKTPYFQEARVILCFHQNTRRSCAAKQPTLKRRLVLVWPTETLEAAAQPNHMLLLKKDGVIQFEQNRKYQSVNAQNGLAYGGKRSHILWHRF